MRIKLKINIKKILKGLKVWFCRVPYFLVQHAFWVFVIIFIIQTLFAFVVFYYYSLPSEEIEEVIVSFSQEKERIERVVQEILKRQTEMEREYFELFEVLEEVD